MVYENFTRYQFETILDAILADNPTDIPQGYDLFMSFYNYSCNLAITLWLENKTSCSVQSNNFPFPKNMETALDKKFSSLFKYDARTRYARAGAPIIEKGGIVKFSHVSI